MKKPAKLAYPFLLTFLFASAGLWAFQQEQKAPEATQKETPGDGTRPLLVDAGQFATEGAAPRDPLAREQQRNRVASKKGTADSVGASNLKLHRSLGKGSAAIAPPPAPGLPEAPSDLARYPAEKREPEKLAAAGLAKLPEGKMPIPGDSPAKETATYAFGAGRAQLPRWMGAARRKNVTIPYINVNWREQVEFSTTNGLIVDLIHSGPWHGGIVGTMMWGRSYNDLGPLASRIPTLNNTLQGGAYLEYALTKEISVGARLRHDIQGTGAAYGDIYADVDLPSPGLIEHSVRVAVEAMNHAAANRYFGVSTNTAAALGTSPYQPKAGYSQLSLTYDMFVPTSQSTGFALAAGYGKLARTAADSPLVRNFGSSNQRNFMAAFVYHF